MSELFNKCIDIILKSEGGYVNHPKDPGGETKYGIAKEFFPNEDIKNLTIDRAKELYYQKYWDIRFDNLNSHEAALQIFDFGINAGIKRAIRIAQEIATVPNDGLFGAVTVDGINKYKGDFVEDYKQARRDYYTNLAKRKPSLLVFLRGWLNRIDNTHF